MTAETIPPIDPAGSKPILVVDDEVAVRTLFARTLRDAGYATIEAADGEEALEVVASRPVALVVIDRNMPRLDGVGFIEAARARPATRTLPIILVTARAALEDRVTGLDAGADDYLMKPVALDELEARVRAQLRSDSAWSELAGPGLEAAESRRRTIAELEAVIATGAYRPHFQPVVSLANRAIVGYEALTRFDDGTRPDTRFADAERVDLAQELERVTLAAAVNAARALPDAAFLGLNVSPQYVLDGGVAAVLAGARREVVLEISEHAPVDDYAALRAVLGSLDPSVRVAVDDAGSGYASLRHILSLGPTYVKLDIGLISGVDADPARQALVAGLVHFAGEVGCRLIAEGIETIRELKTLDGLGVPLGQGYLLGRPALVRAVGSTRTRNARTASPGARRPRDDARQPGGRIAVD